MYSLGMVKTMLDSKWDKWKLVSYRTSKLTYGHTTVNSPFVSWNEILFWNFYLKMRSYAFLLETFFSLCHITQLQGVYMFLYCTYLWLLVKTSVKTLKCKYVLANGMIFSSPLNWSPFPKLYPISLWGYSVWSNTNHVHVTMKTLIELFL